MNRHDYFLEDIAFLTRHSPANEIVYAINASLRFSYIYFETPKAACSTIKRFLIKNEFENIKLFDDADTNYTEFRYLHDREFSPLLNVKQLYPFKWCLRSDRFFKFCFVRNPYERLLSAYLDKILNRRNQIVQIRMALGLVSSDTRAISFDEFVRAVCSIPVFAMDAHWKVQYHHLCMDEIGYDLVGRVENFDADIDRVCQATGLDKRHLETFSPHRSNAKGRVTEYYTEELRKLVSAKFECDFDAFGYSR